MGVAEGADKTRDRSDDKNESRQAGPSAVADLGGGHDQRDEREFQSESEGRLRYHPGDDGVHLACDDERGDEVQELGDRESHDEPPERDRPRTHDQTVGERGHWLAALTGVGSGSPRTPASRLAAAIAAIRPRVASVADAMCGRTMQLASPRSGSSPGIGSGSVTSKPAAAITPSRNAAASAPWSTTGPRDVLTSTAVGFIRASAAASMRPRVSGASETCNDTMSLRSSSSGRLT